MNSNYNVKRNVCHLSFTHYMLWVNVMILHFDPLCMLFFIKMNYHIITKNYNNVKFLNSHTSYDIIQEQRMQITNL